MLLGKILGLPLGFSLGGVLGSKDGSPDGMTLVVGVKLGISLGTKDGLTLMDGIKLGASESNKIFVAVAAVTGSPTFDIDSASCSRSPSIFALNVFSKPVEFTVFDEIEIVETITNVPFTSNFRPLTAPATNEQDTNVHFTSRSAVSG